MTDSPRFVVDSEGELLSARVTNGEVIFTGESERIARARQAAEQKLQVQFLPGVAPLQATLSSDEGILAALLASAPGRCRVVAVPQKLLERLHQLADVRPGQIY